MRGNGCIFHGRYELEILFDDLSLVRRICYSDAFILQFGFIEHFQKLTGTMENDVQCHDESFRQKRIVSNPIPVRYMLIYGTNMARMTVFLTL